MNYYTIYKGKLTEGKIEIGRGIGEAMYSDDEGMAALFYKGINPGKYWIVPTRGPSIEHDFEIITMANKKQFESVGVGFLRLDGKDKFIQLNWDFFGHDRHFIKLEKGEEKIINFNYYKRIKEMEAVS